jgi:hypothetical protein
MTTARRVVAAFQRLLARLSDRALFAICLGGLAAGIGLFLVLPLAPKFVPMHRLPTNRDFEVQMRPEGQVTAFWVVSMASFALAVWQWRRGRRASWALLLAGVAVLHLLALLVPPVASKDVYAYSFYGKVQTAYGANPYLSFPDQHPTDPWHKFWSWRLTGPVYGPPFLLLLRLLATAAGPSLLTWVVLAKLVLVAAELAAVWVLVRTVRAAPGSGQDPRWPLLLIGWNPMVLQSIAMSAHVDALLLLVLAGGLLAHRRGRHLLAFLALVGCFLLKVYMGPLAALYALWLAAGRPRLRDRVAVVAGLGALGTALTALAYLPYASAGRSLFTSAVDVSGHFSSGSPPNLVRRLLAAALPLFGLSEPSAAAVGARVGRQLAMAGILVAFVLVARRLRAGTDPWPKIATFFLAYLLLTPWVFYWHEVPLLGIVAAVPWSLTSLGAVALSITLVPLAPGGPPALGLVRTPPAKALFDTVVAFAGRYGGAVLALWVGLRGRRARRRAGDAPSAPAGVAWERADRQGRSREQGGDDADADRDLDLGAGEGLRPHPGAGRAGPGGPDRRGARVPRPQRGR